VALKTAVKGVYYWESARELLKNHDDQTSQHEWLWQMIADKAQIYREMLLTMKQGLTEPASGGIDRLLDAIKIGQEQIEGKAGD
jgi:hypothetical protein